MQSNICKDPALAPSGGHFQRSSDADEAAIWLWERWRAWSEREWRGGPSNPILGQRGQPPGNCALAAQCRLIRRQPDYVVGTETKDADYVTCEFVFEPTLLDGHDRLLGRGLIRRSRVCSSSSLTYFEADLNKIGHRPGFGFGGEPREQSPLPQVSRADGGQQRVLA
jgi:hypothetical protein